MIIIIIIIKIIIMTIIIIIMTITIIIFTIIITIIIIIIIFNYDQVNVLFYKRIFSAWKMEISPKELHLLPFFNYFPYFHCIGFSDDFPIRPQIINKYANNKYADNKYVNNKYANNKYANNK